MRKKSILLLSFLLLFNLHNVKAATNDDAQPSTSLPFNVNPEFPTNQDHTTKGYFNLNVEPGHSQQIFVNVKNILNHPIDLEIKPANALTSISGGIVYQDKRGNNLTTLTDSSYYMDQYIHLSQEVKLGGYEEKQIPVTIDTPNKTSGTLLGGLLFTLKDAGETTQQSKDRKVVFTLKNRVVFCMAVQLNFPQPDQKPLEIKNISNLIFPSGTNVSFQLENESGSIKKDVSYKYEIQDQNGNDVFKGEIQPFNVAPKSKVNIPISWEGNQYKTGQYKLVLHPSYTTNLVSKKFEINNADVQQYVKDTGHKAVTPVMTIPFYYWILVALLILGLIYGAYQLGRKKEETPSRREAA